MAKTKDITIRRTLALTVLDSRPGELRQALQVPPISVSHLLHGHRSLRPEEFHRFMRFARARLKALFVSGQGARE